MPQRITWDEEDPKIERRGFTDYLKTNKGWKPIRVFDGRGQGRFRLTRVGRRYYEKNTLNNYVVQLPALFRTYKEAGAPPVIHRGFYPIEGLAPAIRRRLDAVFDPAEGAALPAAARAAEIEALKTSIKDTLQQSLQNRRTEDGELILSYESDQEILFEAARPWKISYLDTDVTRNGQRDPSKWTVRMEASLDQVMRSSRPRPAQLLRSELLMDECFDETDEICALHQLSAKTGIDYGTLFEEFQRLHWEFYQEGELIAVSPRLLITW